MKMKQVWSSPKTSFEQFVPQNYIAACGDTERVYKFVCDAPAGNLYYYKTGDGKIDGYYTGRGSATLLGSYHPCDEKHEASTTDSFYDGFVDYNKNKRCDSGEECIVWRGPWNNNGHSTAQLNMNEWEVAKS